MSDYGTQVIEKGIKNLNFDDTASDSETPSPKRHIIAENDDVEFLATNGDLFLVSSQVLSAASPKFKIILAEKDYTKEPFVTYEPAAANSIILNAYHGKIREPETLSELAEVAHFINVYGLQEELKRHITAWVDAWAIDDMDGLDLDTLASWINISWSFGLEEEFEMATREVIRFCKYNSNDAKALYRDPPLDIVNEDVMDKIIDLQQARLNRLVSYLEEERDKRISLGLGANCKSGNASIPRVLEDRKRCDSYQLGNLIYAMHSENMPSTSQSIHEAVGNLEAIAELGTHNPEYNHDACSWNRQMRDWLVDLEEEDLCLKLSSFPGRLPIIALRNAVSEKSGRNAM